jgi:predicted small secreted protein
MKLLVTVVLAALLTACGTVGGTVGGMGEDLTRAGNWIKTR